MRVENCIFVDTPTECHYAVEGNCTAPSFQLFSCLSNHLRICLHEGASNLLVGAVNEEVGSSRRRKLLSGQEGRESLVWADQGAPQR